ncbi:hypothetical protein GTO91_08915 [Heliobacterium undosum]|uniref:Uncharacterized protein n=1 Tax=Heliomicrobium undosum TaxID=121734 RepID=A0A845L2D2_9FIRM|nr:hypothetical protein [Heliomicrobium undosum]MZP29826.1 hypothetical protein [Heliomicrobium undosum]
MVFLTNKKDAQWIQSAEGQEKMAESLERGVLHYIRSLKER